MVAVNSKNNCPYCEGLHGELARMAGVVGYKDLQAAKTVDDCTAIMGDPAVGYARAFANHHRGGNSENENTKKELKTAYQKVVDTHGPEKAKSVEALCWFLAWGSLGGNTVNGVFFEGDRGSFPIIFAIYYAPLFGVIKGINTALAVMPPMPTIFFQGMGVTLTFA
eukprot:CAMPEP_0113530168 /NCGR_PEP_ID=MMETSP0015_2-20120614/2789_1 /TAXON_ID=2838 /ORGANISM="Odontella" /LENGTH=165 /DNA_ID=CAMNT_0000428859 /DNA_START=278 /DNA_END=772 /DNA_ORIENTATION=+ /assembly_acc=CAM_ASM_000160